RVPGVDVAGWAEYAELPRTVRIADHLTLDEIVGHLAAPCLSPAQEHALITCQAIDDRRRLAMERGVIGVERQCQAAEVGDVLAHRQLAVHMHTREGLIGIELRAE